ncbi:hypothetical protein D3C73_668310 [compost metagenome]
MSEYMNPLLYKVTLAADTLLYRSKQCFKGRESEGMDTVLVSEKIFLMLHLHHADSKRSTVGLYVYHPVLLERFC